MCSCLFAAFNGGGGREGGGTETGGEVGGVRLGEDLYHSSVCFGSTLDCM